jgi:hypothetical protein
MSAVTASHRQCCKEGMSIQSAVLQEHAWKRPPTAAREHDFWCSHVQPQYIWLVGFDRHLWQ